MRGGRRTQNWRVSVRELDDRIHRDLGPRVALFAQGIDVWGNSTMVGVDIRLGGRIGPLWGHRVRYAKKHGPLGLFGPRTILKDFADVESELRGAVEQWLREHEVASLDSEEK